MEQYERFHCKSQNAAFYETPAPPNVSLGSLLSCIKMQVRKTGGTIQRATLLDVYNFGQKINNKTL